MSGRRKRIVAAGACVLGVCFLLYVILVNVLVSAALIPSFMRRLEAFERITEESYALQVQTTDIQENRAGALEETGQWLDGVERKTCTVETADGFTLVAEEFGQEQAGHSWVLLLHGYTGWKEEMYPLACWYSERGFHVLVPDLRCQGESEGDFIGMGWTDHYDCLLWIDHILQEDADAQIVLHGQSMGAATALMMTGEDALPAQVCAVVSDCAYTDAYSMFGDKIEEWFHLPAFPLVDSACLMLRLRGGYDLRDASATEAVKRSGTPTLFIHGDADAMIPVRMAQELYDAAACEKDLLIVEGAGHAQSQDKDPALYYGTVQSFLEERGLVFPYRS